MRVVTVRGTKFGIAGALETIMLGLLCKMDRRPHVATAGRVERGENLVRAAAIPEQNDLSRLLVHAKTSCQFKRPDSRGAAAGSLLPLTAR